MIGAFAMTEPGTGSDIQSMSPGFTSEGDHFILNGHKKWISCAQFAAVFLVFGKLDQRPVACLVPRDSPGLRVEPIDDRMGFRAAGLGEVHFNDVEGPSANLVGNPGLALSH